MVRRPPAQLTRPANDAYPRLPSPSQLNNFTLFGMTFDGNLSIDGLITNLFETTHVHPWVAASHLRWFVEPTSPPTRLYSLTLARLIR